MLYCLLPAGRGVFVAPLIAARVGSTGDVAPDSLESDGAVLTLVACDDFGTPHCPEDSIDWLHHNISAELLLCTPSDVRIYQADFSAGITCRLPAANGIVDFILAPFLWTIRSGLVEGESSDARHARVQMLLAVLRRVLAPYGHGRRWLLLPSFAVARLSANLQKLDSIPCRQSLDFIG